MNQEFKVFALLLAALAIVIALLFAGTTIYQRYLQIARRQAALLLFMAIAMVVATVCFYVQRENAQCWEHSFGRELDVHFFSITTCAILFALTLVPFLAKLYLKWIGNRLTDAEKNPGMDGVRAWLQSDNIFCVLILSLCMWQLFDYSFWGVLALALMALLAYPVLNMASSSFQPPVTKSETLSPERERVLKMLDDGKITADESAELLNALGHTVHLRTPPAASINPPRKIILIGLVLLLIGFFLPWFSVNPGQEANRAAEEMRNNFTAMISQNSSLPNMPNGLSGLNLTTASVNISAGDLKYGLGWWILLLGIAVAALPYVATNLDSETQQKVALISLSLGSILLIYLLTQNVCFTGVGIILSIVGYALEFVGLLKERQLKFD